MRAPTLQNPLAWLLALILLSAVVPASAQQPAPQKATRDDLTIDPATMMKPWKGDLDGMIGRRLIRVLVVNSKTFYFQDQGTQRGTTYDFFRVFEEDLNKQLEKQGKLRQKHLKVRVVFIPIARGDLLQALAAAGEEGRPAAPGLRAATGTLTRETGEPRCRRPPSPAGRSGTGSARDGGCRSNRSA